MLQIIMGAVAEIAAENPALGGDGWHNMRDGEYLPWLWPKYYQFSYEQERKYMQTPWFAQQVLSVFIYAPTLPKGKLGCSEVKLLPRSDHGYVSRGAAVVALMLLGFKAKRDRNTIYTDFVSPKNKVPHPALKGALDDILAWAVADRKGVNL